MIGTSVMKELIKFSMTMRDLFCNKYQCIEVALQGVLRKRCSQNMQQTYRRTPLAKYDFNKVALLLYWNYTWHGCSPVKLLHTFRTLFPKNIFWRLLLNGIIRRCLVKDTALEMLTYNDYYPDQLRKFVFVNRNLLKLLFPL